MHPPLRLGTRHWDHVLPLALGDVEAPLRFHHARLDATPDLWSTTDYDLAETSFSRYVRAVAAGDDRVVALPVFVMRGFRHRCILVRSDAEHEAPGDLAGARIGLTGWPDSGNTWTRALLVDAGVGLEDADWHVGPLTADAPSFDRLGGTVPGDHVSALPEGRSLVEELTAGRLDAIMTPFLPPGFYTQTQVRTLFRDTQAAEADYYDRHRFIPGIHLIAARREALPDAERAQHVLDAFEAAKRISAGRRGKLLDVLPWQNQEYERTRAVFGSDWQPYGWSADRAMVAEFQRQLIAQGLLAGPVPEADLFPFPLEPTTTTTEELVSQ